MPPPSRSYRPRRVIAAAVADALISLPRDIVDEILNRVPPRDAVRTSVLSRAWRRRWEEVASLNLDFFDSYPDDVGAVDSILLRCPGRVRRFRAFLDTTHEGRLHDWFIALSRRGVGTIHILGLQALPPSVFTGGRLTSLRLQFCAIPPLPVGFQGLPELRELTLAQVKLQEDGQHQVEEIIATSPALQEVTVWGLDIPGEFTELAVIQAPNLRSLDISSANNYRGVNDHGWGLGDLPRLESAAIDIWVRDFPKLLSGLASVTELDICTHRQPSNWAHILETLPCTFVKLKTLTLQTHFYELPSILSTFCFLRNAPNLERLEIQIGYHDGMEQKFEANGEFQNAQCTDGMCANLQFVNMAGIHWFSNEMSFIELILSKAKLLRTLSISLNRYGEQAMSNEVALKKLLNYKKTSTHAEVIFKGKLVLILSFDTLSRNFSMLHLMPGLYLKVKNLTSVIAYQHCNDT